MLRAVRVRHHPRRAPATLDSGGEHLAQSAQQLGAGCHREGVHAERPLQHPGNHHPRQGGSGPLQHEVVSTAVIRMIQSVFLTVYFKSFHFSESSITRNDSE